EAVGILRIEAGLVILDYDYTAHTVTPFDLGLDRLVCLDGADFLGREALRRVAADPPNRWVTLRLGSEELPGYGAAVTRGGRRELTRGPPGQRLQAERARHEGGADPPPADPPTLAEETEQRPGHQTAEDVQRVVPGGRHRDHPSDEPAEGPGRDLDRAVG